MVIVAIFYRIHYFWFIKKQNMLRKLVLFIFTFYCDISIWTNNNFTLLISNALLLKLVFFRRYKMMHFNNFIHKTKFKVKNKEIIIQFFLFHLLGSLIDTIQCSCTENKQAQEWITKLQEFLHFKYYIHFNGLSTIQRNDSCLNQFKLCIVFVCFASFVSSFFLNPNLFHVFWLNRQKQKVQLY